MKKETHIFVIVMLLIISFSGAFFVSAADGLNGDLFSQQEKIFAADGAEGDLFGCSLSIDGDNHEKDGLKMGCENMKLFLCEP